MDEHELRESLRRLPDARSGAAFTAEVLARVEQWERQRAVTADGGVDDAARGGVSWRPALLAAGLAAALIVAAGLWQPPAGGRGPGIGGDRSVAPEAPGTERLGEESGGALANRGEDEAFAPARAAQRDEERADGGIAGDGLDGASAEPRPERLAGMGDGARPGGGERASGAVSRSSVATPGAPDVRGSRNGSHSPRAAGSQQRPPGDRGSATEAGSSIDGERLASAPAIAAGSDEGSGAGARRAAAPAAVALPGADFIAGRPAGGFEPPAALPAAQRLARLRAEREALERRLVAFRRELPPAEPPVVLLGGDEGLELVFDLGRWAAPPAGEAAGAVRPAVHSTPGPPRRF